MPPADGWASCSAGRNHKVVLYAPACKPRLGPLCQDRCKPRQMAGGGPKTVNSHLPSQSDKQQRSKFSGWVATAIGPLVLVDLIVELAITFSNAIPMASEIVHRMGLSFQQNTGRQLAFALLGLRLRFALGPSPLI